MASKKSLLSSTKLKVEHFSGFDKSRFNAFTAPLGAIVPMVKQLCIPGKGKCSVKISAQLPPLATDAFLRTHLKLEAFFVPMRLCYGGFQSWFSGEQVSISSANSPSSELGVAKLPRLALSYLEDGDSSGDNLQETWQQILGPHSLMDYFGVKVNLSDNGSVPNTVFPGGYTFYKGYFNIFPFIAYQLCYHHWYRNKMIERPLFAPPAISVPGSDYSTPRTCHLPYIAYSYIGTFSAFFGKNSTLNSAGVPEWAAQDLSLLNGHLLELRQRNYGADYFTTALNSPQDGDPVAVDTSSGLFTISALRIANTMQHFNEVNKVASPDYCAVMKARYNRAPSSGVAQKPILLGSADFPMYTSGVEQTASGQSGNGVQNPFSGVGTRFGRAYAEGGDFVCSFDVDEPGYLLVMASVVPEANYGTGIDRDMRNFTQEGSIMDMPLGDFENVGFEPIYASEISGFLHREQGNGAEEVFGYQPRYMWHKAGARNEVHGLFRPGASLSSFIPQRVFGGTSVVPGVTKITSDFLKVKPSDLDDVTAVAGDISKYGVMVDSYITLSVVEPLGESCLPSLADPAHPDGVDVYVKRGGVSVND